MLDTPEQSEVNQTLRCFEDQPTQHEAVMNGHSEDPDFNESGRSTPTPPVESVMASAGLDCESTPEVPSLARADTAESPESALESVKGSSIRKVRSRTPSRQSISNAEPYTLGLRRSSTRKSGGSISRRASLRSSLSKGASGKKLSLSQKKSSMSMILDAVEELKGVAKEADVEVPSRGVSLAREVLEELCLSPKAEDVIREAKGDEEGEGELMDDGCDTGMDVGEPCSASELDPMVAPPPLLSPVKSISSEVLNLTSATSEVMENEATPVAAGGPPPPMEIVLSFDTTGSMSSILDEVRGRMQHMIERLFADIPDLKISVVAHGDYCDATHFYVTTSTDFTSDPRALCEFVGGVGGTGGGDWEECYELVLREVREKLSWTPGSRRALVMIGDAIPHKPDYPLNTDNIDWREEVRRLHQEMGVKIYGVQCMAEKHATAFWQELAASSGGRHVKLDKFSDVIHMLMAVCYREHGVEYFEAYEKEIRGNKGLGMTRGLSNVFDALRDGDAPTPSPSTSTPSPTKARKVGAKKATKSPTTLGRASLKLKTKATALPPSVKKVVKKASSDRKVTPKKTIRKRRETIPETRFGLNRALTFTPWKLAMAKECPEKGKEDWAPRRQGEVGFRKCNLFPGDTRRPAVYEFAAQPLHGCRKCVVYMRATATGFRIRWDTYLLRHKSLRAQVDKVLEQGCKLFIRRALVSKRPTRKVEGTPVPDLSAVRNYLSRNFDYAWCKPTRRPISRRGVILSNPKI